MKTLEALGQSSGRLVASGNGIDYGPLRPVESQNTGETLIALPQGFEYTLIGKTGSKMSDGHPTPRGHDGMAAFNVNGQLRLVRNHEINNRLGVEGAAFGDQSKAYDSKAAGGTTTLIIDPDSPDSRGAGTEGTASISLRPAAEI